MSRTKKINGVVENLTSQEETDRDLEESLWAAGPTSAEVDKELEDITSQLERGKTFVRALAVKLYKIEKRADATLTPKKFRQQIKDIIAGF